MRFYLPILAAGAIAAGACADQGAPTGPSGPKLDLNIAALNLQGVNEAIWDIQVKNGATTPQTVFETRITSSQYGDAGGSATYIGTCDAQAGSKTVDSDTFAENTVNVWIVGLYDGALPGTDGAVGAFGAGDDENVRLANGVNELDFRNPGLLSQVVKCRENSDTFVEFNVALMRPANQGFFDIAVNFNDIFCSAKYDCGAENLLFDGSTPPARGKTHIIGFACTSGDGTDAQTDLWMENIKLTCGGITTTINANGEGNLCAAVAANSAGLADGACDDRLDVSNGGTAPFFQIAAYQGQESSQTGQAIVYWNVALGIASGGEAGGANNCTLSFDATADNTASPVLDGGAITAGEVYPFIHFNVHDVGQCAGNYPINTAPDADGTGVTTVYTTTTAGPNYGHGVFGTVYPVP